MLCYLFVLDVLGVGIVWELCGRCVGFVWVVRGPCGYYVSMVCVCYMCRVRCVHWAW